MGICVNAMTAYLISRVKIHTLAVISAVITMIASPLMATVTIGENYWYAPFWAMFLSPVNPDGMFRYWYFPLHRRNLASAINLPSLTYV